MNLCATPFRRNQGFSLLELLIAIVVVGLLASVALPSFMDSIRKSRRSEAFTALSNVQQAQERWRSNNSSYSDKLTDAAPTGLGLSATTPGGYYGLALANVSATGYDVVATAASGTSQIKDGGCAKLGTRVSGGNVQYASAAVDGTLTYANTDKCWSR